MTTIRINNEKNGIEIRFDCKPAASVIEGLKANGFRWSGKQKMWYAKQSDERMAFANSLDNCAEVKKSLEKSEKPYNLFEMTRTDNIKDHYAESHLTDTKEIAAIIRKHIRARFPMCKWSVRSDYNSIDVTMKSSPWDRESAEVQAIAEYVYRFVDSYNYNNSDYYSDYFDVNFYGSYHPNNIVSRYEYEQREETVGEHTISEQFKIDLAEFEKSEEERKQREHEEAMREYEIARKRAEEFRKRMEAETAEIEANHTTEDCEMWAVGVQLVANKVPNLNSKDDEYYTRHGRVNCKIARKVFMSEHIYNLFINEHLITDFSFLEHMGGSDTDDYRVKDMEDYTRMSKEERETVEWYNTNCVAIYCENVLKLVIDPQGYNYGRYVYEVDEKSVVTETFAPNTGTMTLEKLKEYESVAEELEKAKDDILAADSDYIVDDDKSESDYNSMGFELFRAEMVNYINSHKVPFNANIVRAIPVGKFKYCMYRVLNETINRVDQMRYADMKQGGKYTVVQSNGFGWVSINHVTFESYEIGKYAQYENTVKLIVKLPRKRGLYSIRIYGEALIYDGWVDIPKDIFYTPVESKTPGVSIQRSIISACDPKQFDIVIDYCLKKGLKPIFNTYKPVFEYGRKK